MNYECSLVRSKSRSTGIAWHQDRNWRWRTRKNWNKRVQNPEKKASENIPSVFRTQYYNRNSTVSTWMWRWLDDIEYRTPKATTNFWYLYKSKENGLPFRELGRLFQWLIIITAAFLDVDEKTSFSYHRLFMRQMVRASLWAYEEPENRPSLLCQI